jgi:hypothetical protein
MAWYMGKPDIWVVAHPPMPVAQAKPGCFHPYDHSISWRSRILRLFQADVALKLVIDRGFHPIKFNSIP